MRIKYEMDVRRILQFIKLSVPKSFQFFKKIYLYFYFFGHHRAVGMNLSPL